MNAIVKAVRIAAVLLITVLLPACKNKPVYMHFETLPAEGWHADSLCTFTWVPEDTTDTYQILFHLRHTNAYPYQNLWLFVTRSEGNRSVCDTLEIYLADDRGTWLGNGRNGLISMPVLYDDNYRPHDTLTLSICQGMRDTMLRGVRDVGVEITVDN